MHIVKSPSTLQMFQVSDAVGAQKIPDIRHCFDIDVCFRTFMETVCDKIPKLSLAFLLGQN
jgi:hypothetical protein